MASPLCEPLACGHVQVMSEGPAPSYPALTAGLGSHMLALKACEIPLYFLAVSQEPGVGGVRSALWHTAVWGPPVLPCRLRVPISRTPEGHGPSFVSRKRKFSSSASEVCLPEPHVRQKGGINISL